MHDVDIEMPPPYSESDHDAEAGSEPDAAVPQETIMNGNESQTSAPQTNSHAGSGQNTEEDDIRQDYRRHIQRALRSIKIRKGDYAYSDTVFFEDLQAVPAVVLKKIGRVPLPLCSQYRGAQAHCIAFLAFFCSCA